MSLGEARTALYGTVGAVTITDALYSCSKRWLKTSMCNKPRNPSLRERKRSKSASSSYTVITAFLPEYFCCKIRGWEAGKCEHIKSRPPASPQSQTTVSLHHHAGVIQSELLHGAAQRRILRLIRRVYAYRTYTFNSI